MLDNTTLRWFQVQTPKVGNKRKQMHNVFEKHNSLH